MWCCLVRFLCWVPSIARPLRIEFAGALYHVTSRGDGREDVCLDETDRQAFYGVPGQVCVRFIWLVHAKCQMTNHYHLLMETPEANLAWGMRRSRQAKDKA